MRIVDKHILKFTVELFLVFICLFFFLYIIIDVFSNLQDIIQQKTSLLILKDYYLAFLPSIFVIIAPIACLLSVVISLSKLNNDNEIIAMRSAGMTLWQIAKPALIFAFVVSLGIFFVNEQIVPGSVVKAHQLKKDYIDNVTTVQSRLKDKLFNVTFYGANNRLYYIDTFYPATNTFEGMTIIEQDRNQNMTAKTYAVRGEYTRGRWTFYQCQIFYFDDAGRIKKESQYFEEATPNIPEKPEDFLRQQMQVEFMNIRQLRDYLGRFSESGARGIIRNLTVALHQRIAYPFSNVVIVLVGLPFALMRRRRIGITFTSIGICIACGFLYYFSNSVSTVLGQRGFLEPMMAAWLPNALFFIISVYLLRELS